jgi:hypothetical protein
MAVSEKAAKKAVSDVPVKVGRKWFDGKDEQLVLTKCKEVWAIGGTDEEAAFYAETSTASISRYLTAHPDVAEIRNRLKEKPVLKARQTVVQKLGESYANAMDYLSRKRKAEFGGATGNVTAVQINVQGLSEHQQKLLSILEGNAGQAHNNSDAGGND